MVATCANPNCLARFRYLHEGRLFSLEARPSATSDAKLWNVPGATEFFWLCDSCSRTMTLVSYPLQGVTLILKEDAKRTPTRLVQEPGKGGQHGTAQAA